MAFQRPPGPSALSHLRPFLKSYGLLIIFCLTTFFILSFGFRSSFLFHRFLQANEANLNERLKESAALLAELFTARELTSYRSLKDIQRPDYQALKQRLADFVTRYNLHSAVFLRVDKGFKQYIIDSDFDPRTSLSLITPKRSLKYETLLNEALKHGGQIAISKLDDFLPGQEGLITAYAPVFDERGHAAVFAGISIKNDFILESKTTVNSLLTMQAAAVLAAFLSGIMGFIHYRRVAHQAQSLSQAKAEFLSIMSHEIRTPMNAIIALSELIEKNFGSKSSLEYLGVLRRAGQNLMRIINDVLDFSKIEAGRMRMHEEPYDVGALLNDVAMLTKLRIQGKDIQFTADISSRLPSIMIGDEIRIRQILNNLLSNAAKYTEKGFIKLSAHSQDAENNEITVTFKVSDTGIGILPKDISRLFSDYCRLEDSLAAGVEGTGLGLSITRRLCRNMGGDVAVSSAFRRGSEFTATIKQKVNPDVLSLGSLKFSPTDFATADINFTLENFRVLSVDDNEMNLVVLEGLFSTYQATVVSCLGGREALKAIQEQPFDLIFLDYIMPDLDGIQTAAAIRDMGGRFLSLPLIALTADADLGSEETFLKNGFNDFLPKPLDMNSLHRVILKWAPLEKRKIKFDFVNSDLGPIQDKAQPSPSSTPKLDFKILKFGNR